MKKKYFKEFDYKIFFKKLEIHKYENILINSNILEFLINQKRNKQIFKISKFVNHLINALNSKATLFIPAYNWDFCKGKIYDPQKTEPKTGSLAKAVMSRSDFVRTNNPIYSFFVYGKKAQKFLKKNDSNCFSIKSVFGYLIEKKAINLFLGVDYKNAFTFVHVAEQKARVNYRYLKVFKGKVVQNKKIKKKQIKLYVRNLKMGISATEIDKKLDKELFKKKLLINRKVLNIKVQKLLISEAYNLILKDLSKKNFKFVIPKKIQ